MISQFSLHISPGLRAYASYAAMLPPCARALNLRNCHISIAPAIRLASKSEIGMLYQTPATPKKRGRIIRQGSNSIIWRVRERNIALLACPMLWKKFAVTI